MSILVHESTRTFTGVLSLQKFKVRTKGENITVLSQYSHEIFHTMVALIRGFMILL
jgi:hypothetical protein